MFKYILQSAYCPGFIVFAFSILPMTPIHAQDGTDWQLTGLYSFSGSNGSSPTAGLVEGSDGNFYGTTSQGGTFGRGTVFKVATDGTLSSLYSFSGTDGASPAGLVRGNDGNFYGTTRDGGLYEHGTIFAITPQGSLTNLYSYPGTNGGFVASLMQSKNGNFYGTTISGGPNGSGSSIFTFTQDGTLTNIYWLTYVDGLEPYGRLAQGSDGNLYGTAAFGGNVNAGTVFKITPDGIFTTLHSFQQSDGWQPYGSLRQAADGSFYGTTYYGGTNGDCPYGCGTIFKITAEGTLTSLHTFTSADGAAPYAGLEQGSDGNFYGTTQVGGDVNYGTAYEITPNGVLSSLVSFSGPDGAYPYASLTLGSDGNFYGTTYGDISNGPSFYGSVYKLSVVMPATTTPIFTPESGSYSNALRVTISDSTPGAVIYYTTDGSTPTPASMIYTKPIPILFSKSFQAIAIAPNDASSAIAKATYTISRRWQ